MSERLKEVFAWVLVFGCFAVLFVVFRAHYALEMRNRCAESAAQAIERKAALQFCLKEKGLSNAE